jgi:SAM-dependent methyltransferase
VIEVNAIVTTVQSHRPLPPYQQAFADAIAADPRLRGGHVLDIGCGNFLHPALQFVPVTCGQYDGVDPSAEVLANERVRQRWHAPFESAPVPPAAYDLAIAYNVVEHIRTARPFFEKLAEVLRPGGAFYALSPHARHPFAWMSRAAEVIGLKPFFARRLSGVNSYPAYYRLNSRRQIRRALAGLPLRLTGVWFWEQRGWERGYLPRGLRMLPALYDRAVTSRVPSLRQTIIYRIERDAQSSNRATRE